MLNYKIINYKKTVKRNGKTYLDLMSKSYCPKIEASGEFIIVNKHYVARPDLISLAMYKTDEYADILCKINGISNPFELNEDDVLFVPNIEFIVECCKVPAAKSKFIEDTSDTIASNDDKSLQKKPSDRRSPNQQTIGESNYVINNNIGMIFY